MTRESRASKGSLRPGRIAAAAAVFLGMAAAILVGGLPAISPTVEEGEQAGTGVASAPAPAPHFTPDRVEEVIEPVREQIDASAFAGAGVALGVGGREFMALGLGHIGWTRNAPPVDPDSTMYDLASLTKVLATASAVLLLVDEGRMKLDEPVSRYLPQFATGPKSEVTIRHILTHRSGLPAGTVLRGETRSERLDYAASLPIYPPAGAHEEYSDVGFILLWDAAERAAGEPLTAYLQRKLYRPLGMTATRFAPGLDCEPCAPTGRLRDQSLYRGRAFDPIAQQLDGISGNAGLFSSARDVGRFTAMVVNGGELDGVRIFSPEIAREFVAIQPSAGRFRIAWEEVCDRRSDDADQEDETGCRDPIVIGHTGWTGGSIRIDLDRGVWVVLLTNRTYEPRAPNRIQEVRRELFARAVKGAPMGRPLDDAGGDATAPEG